MLICSELFTEELPVVVQAKLSAPARLSRSRVSTTSTIYSLYLTVVLPEFNVTSIRRLERLLAPVNSK